MCRSHSGVRPMGWRTSGCRTPRCSRIRLALKFRVQGSISTVASGFAPSLSPGCGVTKTSGLIHTNAPIRFPTPSLLRDGGVPLKAGIAKGQPECPTGSRANVTMPHFLMICRHSGFRSDLLPRPEIVLRLFDPRWIARPRERVARRAVELPNSYAEVRCHGV